MQSYFFFMQGEKHERAILKGECPVDIQVREPLAVAKPRHRRGFLTRTKWCKAEKINNLFNEVNRLRTGMPKEKEQVENVNLLLNCSYAS
ncbi:MAG: hypothetical protein GY705_28420 [Bacteroidetes bacterium]|nr:hypothetical protein [Bacteroidota bacterium]